MLALCPRPNQQLLPVSATLEFTRDCLESFLAERARLSSV